MQHSKWYIKEQCERIRDDVAAIEKLVDPKEILTALENITLTSYKIEADAIGVDLVELVKR